MVMTIIRYRILLTFVVFAALFGPARAEDHHDAFVLELEIELSQPCRIEPYFARQNDSHSASGNVNRLGLVLKAYL
jgi:hypothetical protein